MSTPEPEDLREAVEALTGWLPDPEAGEPYIYASDLMPQLASLLAATADSARADERGKVAEAIAQAIEAEREFWQYAVNRRALDAAARIARDGGR